MSRRVRVVLAGLVAAAAMAVAVLTWPAGNPTVPDVPVEYVLEGRVP